MRFDRLALPLAVMALAALGACGDGKVHTGDEVDSTEIAPLPLAIVKAEKGPDYPDAKLKVLVPGPDQVVKTDSVMVKVELTGVNLETPTAGEQSKGIAYSRDGQHIHVIIDEKPYMAMYKTDSFSVGKLTPGAHSLRAFPSRSWHESIKTPGAFVAETFYYKTRTGAPIIKAGEPLLTYSRPKGEYKGADARQILLDFYLSNAELGPDKYKVIASIDGQVKDTLLEWSPYYIEGLSDGEHTVQLQLIAPDGKPVPGVFNAAVGKIKVTRAETAAPPMHHDSGSGAPHDSGAAAAPKAPAR